MGYQDTFGVLGQQQPPPSKYDGGEGPFLKHQHGCTWWRGTNYAEIAHNEAKLANDAYLGVKNTVKEANFKLKRLQELDSNKASQYTSNLKSIEKKSESLKDKIIQDEPKQSFNCPDPGWYKKHAKDFSQWESQARDILGTIDGAIEAAEKEAARKAAEAAAARQRAQQPQQSTQPQQSSSPLAPSQLSPLPPQRRSGLGGYLAIGILLLAIAGLATFLVLR